jgi:hypothetical protein
VGHLPPYPQRGVAGVKLTSPAAGAAAALAVVVGADREQWAAYEPVCGGMGASCHQVYPIKPLMLVLIVLSMSK